MPRKAQTAPNEPPKRRGRKKNSQKYTTPTPVAGEYEAEEILDVKIIQGQRFYLIKWKGYTEAENTWEPIANLQNLAADIIAYEQKHEHRIKKMEKEWISLFSSARVSHFLKNEDILSLMRQHKKLEQKETHKNSLESRNIPPEDQQSSYGKAPKTKRIYKKRQVKSVKIQQKIENREQSNHSPREQKSHRVRQSLKTPEEYDQSEERPYESSVDYQEYLIPQEKNEEIQQPREPIHQVEQKPESPHVQEKQKIQLPLEQINNQPEEAHHQDISVDSISPTPIKLDSEKSYDYLTPKDKPQQRQIKYIYKPLSPNENPKLGFNHFSSHPSIMKYTYRNRRKSFSKESQEQKAAEPQLSKNSQEEVIVQLIDKEYELSHPQDKEVSNEQDNSEQHMKSSHQKPIDKKEEEPELILSHQKQLFFSEILNSQQAQELIDLNDQKQKNDISPVVPPKPEKINQIELEQQKSQGQIEKHPEISEKQTNLASALLLISSNLNQSVPSEHKINNKEELVEKHETSIKHELLQVSKIFHEAIVATNLSQRPLNQSRNDQSSSLSQPQSNSSEAQSQSSVNIRQTEKDDKSLHQSPISSLHRSNRICEQPIQVKYSRISDSPPETPKRSFPKNRIISKSSKSKQNEHETLQKSLRDYSAEPYPKTELQLDRLLKGIVSLNELSVSKPIIHSVNDCYRIQGSIIFGVEVGQGSKLVERFVPYYLMRDQYPRQLLLYLQENGKLDL